MRSIIQWENVGKTKQLTVTEMKWIFKHMKTIYKFKWDAISTYHVGQVDKALITDCWQDFGEADALIYIHSPRM